MEQCQSEFFDHCVTFSISGAILGLPRISVRAQFFVGPSRTVYVAWLVMKPSGGSF
jgi:hypothetical protein